MQTFRFRGQWYRRRHLDSERSQWQSRAAHESGPPHSPWSTAENEKKYNTSSKLNSNRFRHTTQGTSAVALPQVRYEILQKHRTPGRGVTVVVHLAAPVDSVQRLARAQKAAVASVALVNDRIAAGRALDHRVQVVDAALRATLPRLGGSID